MDFWDAHGLWFIFFMCFFPRLTLLFSNVAFGGVLWWLGWLFTPRLLVAILATMAYGDTNIVLVVFAWFWALAGEGAEKSRVKRSSSSVRRSGGDGMKVKVSR